MNKLHALEEEDRIEHEKDKADAQARLDAAVIRRNRDAAQALRLPSAGRVMDFGVPVGSFLGVGPVNYAVYDEENAPTRASGSSSRTTEPNTGMPPRPQQR